MKKNLYIQTLKITPMWILAIYLLGCEQRARTVESDATPATDQATVNPLESASPDQAPPQKTVAHDDLVDWDKVTWTEHGDEMAIGEAKTLWKEEGVELSMQPWRVGETRGLAWRAKIAREGSFTRVLAASDVQPFGDFLAPDDGPRVMINGGFYESSDSLSSDYEAMGVVRASGRDEHDYVHRGGSGILIVDESGVQIIHRSKWREHQGSKTTDALQSIDRIVDAGETLVLPKQGKPARMAARSGIALNATHIWVVVAVAERSVRPAEQGHKLVGTSYQGMPLWAFARYVIESTDAEQALNLDGAVSTQMEVRAGTQRFSLIGERGTINAVELRPPRNP